MVGTKIHRETLGNIRNLDSIKFVITSIEINHFYDLFSILPNERRSKCRRRKITNRNYMEMIKRRKMERKLSKLTVDFEFISFNCVIVLNCSKSKTLKDIYDLFHDIIHGK